MTQTIRTLLFSSLYPSAARPMHGLFVETRLRHLLATGKVLTKVVAPVPWFPSRSERFGSYAVMAATPARETRHGVDVLHPRYLAIPKIGMSLAPALLAAGAVGALRSVRQEGFDFELIDAHYYYPDGVAAAILAAVLRKPLVITARGTDVNLIPTHLVPRLLVRWAARQAHASVGVSSALVDRLRDLGAPDDRLRVFRNGVDLDRFHVIPRDEARRALELQGAPILLAVGSLNEHKGQRIAIQCLSRVREHHPEARLILVGAGPDRSALIELARTMGLTDAVAMVGTVPNEKLALWYSSADVLVLASSREGWPNVLLEAMACGTPVVATWTGGVPEVVKEPVAGRLVDSRSADAFAAAVLAVLRAGDDRAGVRRYAEGFSWDETSLAQLSLFRALTGSPQMASESAGRR